MIKHEIQFAVMEKILNEDLVVLTGCLAERGERISLIEMQEDRPTGRTFFAKVVHQASVQGVGSVLQIALSPFMEQRDENGAVERMPMIGGSANEKYVTPQGEWNDWQVSVTGEKPVWIYRGMKWIQEIALAKMFFGGPTAREFAMNQMSPPHTLHVKIQAQGGERVFKYTVADEVKAGA